MHVVLYSVCWPPGSVSNGIVTYCSHVKHALEQLGHSVSIVSKTGNRGLVDDCYYIDDSPGLVGRTLRKLFKKKYQQDYYFENKLSRLLEKIDRKNTIDIFEIEESFGWHRIVAQNCNFPVVMRLHGPHFRNNVIEQDKSESSIRKIAREKLAFENVKYLSSPSRYIYELVAKTYDISPYVSQVIANPINISTPEKCWSQIRSNPRQLLFVGRFDLIKGGDIVIQMFARFLCKYPDGRLAFVGPDVGIKDERGNMVKLENYIKLNLSADQISRISIYGRQSPEVILELRAESAVTIVASRTEVFSYCAIEAIAMGCPLVASAIGGIPEIIVHNENGLLFDNGNVDDLLDKVLDLIENPEKAKSIADNGYQTCINKLGMQKLGIETATFYEKCISQH